MNMFETFINSIPKNRSEMVNDLEIPDVTLSPYDWTDYDSLTVRSDSLLCGTDSIEDVKTLSTDSSLPLSRAMTDSEIDYDRYKRFKKRSNSDPRDVMKAALDAFPSNYLASLNSFQNSFSDTTEEILTKERLQCYNEELRLKMERFFEEECRVYTPEDPGLIELHEALLDLDVKVWLFQPEGDVRSLKNRRV
ncbi:hypothetical protein K1T71_007583 [Dendrolimus kikuchii]|uniref:Uncharacterized protein n=1 Tax=Dendrolimus kikuchii TaxID=765133 RepID=A0ACC1CXG8_9NEOP|nr:hypothetical protein K1T71_007583 [Dendrolimus kikuchii]